MKSPIAIYDGSEFINQGSQALRVGNEIYLEKADIASQLMRLFHAVGYIMSEQLSFRKDLKSLEDLQAETAELTEKEALLVMLMIRSSEAYPFNQATNVITYKVLKALIKNHASLPQYKVWPADQELIEKAQFSQKYSQLPKDETSLLKIEIAAAYIELLAVKVLENSLNEFEDYSVSITCVPDKGSMVQLIGHQKAKAAISSGRPVTSIKESFFAPSTSGY